MLDHADSISRGGTITVSQGTVRSLPTVAVLVTITTSRAACSA